MQLSGRGWGARGISEGTWHLLDRASPASPGLCQDLETHIFSPNCLRGTWGVVVVAEVRMVTMERRFEPGRV